MCFGWLPETATLLDGFNPWRQVYLKASARSIQQRLYSVHLSHSALIQVFRIRNMSSMAHQFDVSFTRPAMVTLLCSKMTVDDQEL